MNLREYDESKRALDRRMFALMYNPLKPFLTAPFGAARAALSPVELTFVLANLVLDFQLRSGELARDYYDAERERVTGSPDRHDFYVSTSRPEAVTMLMRRTVNEFEQNLEIAFREDPAENRPDPETEVAKVISSAVNVASMGERSTIQDGSRSDPLCLGWARVDPVPPSCGFCTMLISRGPVYKSEESAGDERNIFHANDTCRVVPVFSEDDWSGRAAFEAANDAYIAASKEASETGESVLTVLRRRQRR